MYELGCRPVVRNDLKWLRTSTKWVQTIGFKHAQIEKLPVRTSTDLNELRTLHKHNTFYLNWIWLLCPILREKVANVTYVTL